jgi:uncharacterized protein (UPF0303 family)
MTFKTINLSNVLVTMLQYSAVLTFCLWQYLIAEALNAGSAIRQNVLWINRKTRVIQVHATASFASICN